MPNAGGVGYYQWSLSPKLVDALTAPDALRALSVPEKMSLARSIHDAFWRGTLDAGAAFAALEKLAPDEHPAVADAPMSLYRSAYEWLEPDLRARLEKRAARLYDARAQQLGWKARPGDTPETKLLRRDVMGFLSFVARDEAVRKHARQVARKYIGYQGDNAIHQDAVDPNAAATALMVYAERPDKTLYDALLYQLDHAADEEIRGNLLYALGAVRAPDMAQRTLDLILDPALRLNELMVPLNLQLADPLTRDHAWSWLTQHVDQLLTRLPERRGGWLPNAAAVFCSDERARETAELFTPRLSQMAGGRRVLDEAMERIHVCAATKAAQMDSLKRLVGP